MLDANAESIRTLSWRSSQHFWTFEYMDPQCVSVESCHVPGAFNVHVMMLPFGAKAKMLVTNGCVSIHCRNDFGLRYRQPAVDKVSNRPPYNNNQPEDYVWQ